MFLFCFCFICLLLKDLATCLPRIVCCISMDFFLRVWSIRDFSLFRGVPYSEQKGKRPTEEAHCKNMKLRGFFASVCEFWSQIKWWLVLISSCSTLNMHKRNWKVVIENFASLSADFISVQSLEERKREITASFMHTNNERSADLYKNCDSSTLLQHLFSVLFFSD